MILDFIRSEKSPPSLVHLCFKFLYVICKVSFLIKNLLTALNKSRNVIALTHVLCSRFTNPARCLFISG